MPRRKPISGKQKKEQQQIKRAIKRGDLPPPEPTKKPSRKRRIGPTGKIVNHPSSDAVIASARKLQSTFIKLPPKFLEVTKAIASTVPISRPITYHVALLHDFSAEGLQTTQDPLSCPKRPKWRFEMSKKEVEHNEEGAFKKWLSHTDQLIEVWQKGREPEASKSDEMESQSEQPLLPPPSPTYFERNLEVWRQLWRVTEMSQIILVLLDSRCPLLHFPPSLAAYLAGCKVILVLTKVDIAGPVRVAAWMNYFRAHYPDILIVQVESYLEKEATTVHQGRKQYEPHLPGNLRQRLIDAIKVAHSEMLQPPESVAKNPNWSKKWIPPAKRDIDWNIVLNAIGDQVGTATPKTKPKDDEADEKLDNNQESDVLTIGLLGQPNVGKSSLLNALLGTQRVRASKTPGKTKHFQTLYWTHDVRLVDCPGLVMPNYVPMEMQVLSGILPISKISAIPACINYISQLLPLERVYNLSHPVSSEVPVEDKRTWREGMQPPKPKPAQWTAMDILTAYANVKGWVTAKAGRPDVHRAGNAILRSLSEGRVSWAFWPPSALLDVVGQQSAEADTGIWIPGRDREDEGNSDESDEEEMEKDDPVTSSGEESEEMDIAAVSSGRFDALQIDDRESEEEDEEEED